MPSGEGQSGKKRGPYKKKQTAEQRFWVKVRKGDGCWEWQSATNGKGYGRFQLTSTSTVMAHRYSYELAHGPIPDGMMVCHECDNPCCVKPAHLFLGTARDNAQDRAKKGRSASFHGDRSPRARLSGDDVLLIVELAGAGWSGADLATRFQTSQSTVSLILKGRRWSSVTGIQSS